MSTLPLRMPCPRCGADLPPLAHVAAVAMQAEKGLRAMRLAVPDVTAHGLRLVASALRCHAGLCTPPESATP